MSKNSFTFFLICISIFCFSFSSLCNNRIREDLLREKIVLLAESQIGHTELTNKNDGLQVERYLQSVGLSKGYAWCGAFVNWIYQFFEISAPDKAAWTPAWFPKSKVKWQRGMDNNYIPQPGDLAGFYYPRKRRIAHIALIVEWNPSKSYVVTIEGNTNSAGSRDGDGVYKKLRPKKSIYKVSNWISV